MQIASTARAPISVAAGVATKEMELNAFVSVTALDLRDLFIPLGHYRAVALTSFSPFFTLADGTCDGVVCDQHSTCVPKTAGERYRHCVCLDGWTGDGQNCVGN